MSKIPFTKMHGAGNDYIYVDVSRHPVADPVKASIRWSDRHKGIGSDGLVLIDKASVPERLRVGDGTSGMADLPAASQLTLGHQQASLHGSRSIADFSMRIFNADGSEAMMCGNASRCIGKYLYERGLTTKTEILLQTLSGIKTLKLNVIDGIVESVTVDMLEPVFEDANLFNPDLAKSMSAPLANWRGDGGEAVFVSMGNPHYVIFTDDIDQVGVTGPVLENHPAFPQRCNIEFAHILKDGSIRTRVWERGSGITMACGTGACATAVAASLRGLAPRHSNIIMDGGILSIEWSKSDNHVYMTGPAAFVFDGEIAE